MDINELLQQIIQNSKDEILGIIISGSYKPEDFIKGWSDIDLFVVLTQIPNESQNQIISVCNEFGKDRDIHVGLSFLSKEEYLSKDPNKTYYKALLMKHGFSTGVTSIVYGNLPVQTVDWGIYKEGLLREINFFKAYLRNGQRDLGGKKLEIRAIKCLNHILYASILFKDPSFLSPKPTKEALMEFYYDFSKDWSILDKMSVYKYNIQKPGQDEKTITEIINFAERFLTYFFNKHV